MRAYFIMRKDLIMSPSKMAVQIGHGTDMIHLFHNKTGNYNKWIQDCRRKVVLQIKTEQRLETLINFLEKENISYSRIIDQGLTEFDGNTTLTGIVVYPMNGAHSPKKIKSLQTYR